MNIIKPILAISIIIPLISCTKIDTDSFAPADHSHKYSDTIDIYRQFEPFSATFQDVSGRIASTMISLPVEISDNTHHIFVEVEIPNLNWVKMPFTYLGRTLAFSISSNVLLNLYLVSATSDDLTVPGGTATYNFRIIAIPKIIVTSGATE